MSYLKNPTEGISDTQMQIMRAIGYREQIKGNYVPWVLTALACDQALSLAHAILSVEPRSVVREVRPLAREIISHVRYYMKTDAVVVAGDTGIYEILSEFNRQTLQDQYFTELSAYDSSRNAGANQPMAEIAKHGALALAFLIRAAKWDSDFSARIAKALKAPVHRTRELALDHLQDCLVDLRKSGFAPPLSKFGRDWVEMFVVKAGQHADKMIDDLIAKGTIDKDKYIFKED